MNNGKAEDVKGLLVVVVVRQVLVRCVGEANTPTRKPLVLKGKENTETSGSY